MTQIYQISALIMIKEDIELQNLFGDQFSPFIGKNHKLATYSEMLKSRMILTKVIKELDLQDKETGKMLQPEALKGLIKIGSTGETNFIKIIVTYPDPLIARDIANTLVEVFKAENQKLNRTDLRRVSDFIEIGTRKPLLLVLVVVHN